MNKNKSKMIEKEYTKSEEKIRFWRHIFAIFLIILGLSGIILPILPGWPFLFWGLFILGGIGLIDRTILKHLPRSWRLKILGWVERFEKNKDKK